jgi:UDP-N-acetylmuramoylalanine--D-glutamate ligase
MLDSKKYENKKVAIYGMGLTGQSAARALLKIGAEVFCWDDNKKKRNEIKKNFFGISKFWLKKNLIDIIVVSPGIDINKCKIKKYLINNKSKIITDLDLFFEKNKDALVISVTGTNGKSTTCKILEKILKTANYDVKLLGNIGKPILSKKNEKKKYVYILEVSSYQLQYSKIFRSKHAAILNVSPDHLERHKNMANYIKIKSKIFFAQKENDYSYINYENRHSKYIKNIFKKRKIKSKLTLIKKENLNFFIKKVDNKYFKSRSNIENLAFAYEIAKKLRIKEKTIIKALNNFKGLRHRQEVILSNKKLLCINDSKATSFDASLQSLSNYDRIYWIVGGLPKFKDHFNLNHLKNKIIKAYIIGNSVTFFKKQIGNAIPYSISKNIKNAINNIDKDLIISEDLKSTILLSPAAASFDQFANFETRGDHFRDLIIKKFKRRLNV